MDVVSLIKEIGLPAALVILIGWRFLRQSEEMHKVLSEQAAEAKRDAAKQTERFFDVIDGRDKDLRDVLGNFGHLRQQGSEHSATLGRIEQAIRDRK